MGTGTDSVRMVGSGSPNPIASGILQFAHRLGPWPVPLVVHTIIFPSVSIPYVAFQDPFSPLGILWLVHLLGSLRLLLWKSGLVDPAGSPWAGTTPEGV